MDSIHRSLLAFSIVHVRDDEALGERYEVIEKFDIFPKRVTFGLPSFFVLRTRKNEKITKLFLFLKFS